MGALTKPFYTLVGLGTLKKSWYLLAAGAKAFEGGICCYDTAAPGFVTPGAVSTTLVPFARFLDTVDNSAGGVGKPVGVEFLHELGISYWDTVAGGGAITLANLFQTVYLASDHELTTVSTGASPFGRVFAVAPQGYPNGVGVSEAVY